MEEISRHLEIANAADGAAFLRSPCEQVVRIEFGDAFQFLEIQNGHCPIFPSDQVAFPELLKSPVDVYHRKARGIGEILLGQRQVEAAVRDEPDSFQACGDLADEVRD
nr:hypothetical protein [Bradyrhizobium diazoefficiens]